MTDVRQDVSGRVKGFLAGAFLRNKRYKIVALCLAITLFVLVNTSRPQSQWFRVPVQYQLSDDRAFLDRPPTFVQVEVRGSWRQLKRINEGDFAPVVINVGRSDQSDFSVRDKIAAPTGVRLMTINPPSIRVITAEKVARRVKVIARLEGLPAAGYEVTKWSVSPPDVLLLGPDKLLSDIKEVRTESILLAGRTESFTQTSTVLPPTDLVSLEQTSVEVEVEIGERVIERDLGKKQVTVNRPAGLETLNVKVEPKIVHLVARGAGEAVTDFPDTLTASVQLPAGFSASSGPTSLVVAVTPAVPGVAFEVVPPEITVTVDAP